MVAGCILRDARLRRAPQDEDLTDPHGEGAAAPEQVEFGETVANGAKQKEASPDDASHRRENHEAGRGEKIE